MKGRFITVKGKRKKIKEVVEIEPADRSVGIFFDSAVIETSDNKLYELVSNGDVHEYNEETNETGPKVGKQKCFF